MAGEGLTVRQVIEDLQKGYNSVLFSRAKVEGNNLGRSDSDKAHLQNYLGKLVLYEKLHGSEVPAAQAAKEIGSSFYGRNFDNIFRPIGAGDNRFIAQVQEAHAKEVRLQGELGGWLSGVFEQSRLAKNQRVVTRQANTEWQNELTAHVDALLSKIDKQLNDEAKAKGFGSFEEAEAALKEWRGVEKLSYTSLSSIKDDLRQMGFEKALSGASVFSQKGELQVMNLVNAVKTVEPGLTTAQLYAHVAHNHSLGRALSAVFKAETGNEFDASARKSAADGVFFTFLGTRNPGKPEDQKTVQAGKRVAAAYGDIRLADVPSNFLSIKKAVLEKGALSTADIFKHAPSVTIGDLYNGDMERKGFVYELNNLAVAEKVGVLDLTIGTDLYYSSQDAKDILLKWKDVPAKNLPKEITGLIEAYKSENYDHENPKAIETKAQPVVDGYNAKVKSGKIKEPGSQLAQKSAADAGTGTPAKNNASPAQSGGQQADQQPDPKPVQKPASTLSDTQYFAGIDKSLKHHLRAYGGLEAFEAQIKDGAVIIPKDEATGYAVPADRINDLASILGARGLAALLTNQPNAGKYLANMEKYSGRTIEVTVEGKPMSFNYTHSEVALNSAPTAVKNGADVPGELLTGEQRDLYGAIDVTPEVENILREEGISDQVIAVLRCLDTFNDVSNGEGVAEEKRQVDRENLRAEFATLKAEVSHEEIARGESVLRQTAQYFPKAEM